MQHGGPGARVEGEPDFASRIGDVDDIVHFIFRSVRDFSEAIFRSRIDDGELLRRFAFYALPIDEQRS